MRFLVFASGDFESSKEFQGQEQTPFPEFLQTRFSLTQEIVDAIVYALAFCSSNTGPPFFYVLVVVQMTTIGAVPDVTLHALTRLRSYLRSAGRYGSSPFLVGHYGGLGEISQGFCRVSAVNGGVYILGRKIEEITTPTSTSGDKFVINLDDVPGPLTADVLIAAQDQLPLSLHPSPAHDTHMSPIARCIAVIDNPIPFPPLLSSEEGQSEDEVESAPTTSASEDAGGQSTESSTQPESSAEEPFVDTSVVVFPPCSVTGGSSTNVAQAFTTGAGTLSAPQGKCEETLC
jgi:hypothetical protein